MPLPVEHDLGPEELETFKVSRGRQIHIILDVVDADGDAVDLSSHSGAGGTLNEDDGTLIIDLSPTITDAANGEVTVDVTMPADAPLGLHPWDVYVTESSKDYEVARGYILVTEAQ